METNKVRWSDLLTEALEKPGVISQAYSFFRIVPPCPVLT